MQVIYFKGEPKKSTDKLVGSNKNPEIITSITPHNEPEIMVNNVGNNNSLYLFFKRVYLLPFYPFSL